MGYVVDQVVAKLLVDELVAEGAGGAKVLGLECHVLLGLGVEGRVLYEAVHKDPHLTLHVHGLQVHPSFVLSLSHLGGRFIKGVGS